jgi:hypothetical protein
MAAVSCSRFALLNPDKMLGSNTPGAAPTQASPTTPKASAHPSRAPSPTPSLQPAELQEEYEFNGTTYATLEEAIEAARQGLNVPAPLATFMTNCIKEILRCDITKVYNILGNKMYEHKNRHAKDLDELGKKVNDVDLEKDVLIRDLAHRIDQAKADSEVLNNNNNALRFVNQALNNRLNNLEKHVTQLDAQIRALSLSVPALGTSTASGTTSVPAPASRSKPKIADPPKFKGNKTGKITLEQWLQKVGIWLRYQDIKSDEDKITTTLMYLEGELSPSWTTTLLRQLQGNHLGCGTTLLTGSRLDTVECKTDPMFDTFGKIAM